MAGVIRYSIHARRQMARRRITESEVNQAVGFVETSYPSRDHPDRLVVLGRTIDGRRLKVITVETDDGLLVVTAADRDEIA